MLTFTSTVVSNAANTSSVAGSQTPGAAGNLTLTATPVVFGSSAAQKITFTSVSNISNRTLTITGTDIYGLAATEDVTGPNNATVTSTLAYASVTQIAISGVAAGALTAGNSAYAEGQMYIPDIGADPFSIGFGCVITGSPTYTVQHTFDTTTATGYPGPLAMTGPGTTKYVYSSTSNAWFNHAFVAAAVANADGNYAFPVFGVRLTLSAAGTVAMKLIQSPSSR